MGFRKKHGIVDLGVGVGFRPKHADDVFRASSVNVDWFEIVSENYMVWGGRPMANLERLTSAHRVIPHGVSLGIGSDTLDAGYLQSLRALVERVDPPWASDHLCWTRTNGNDLHDLLPLSYTADNVRHVADHVKRVQDVLRRPFALENVSSYMTFKESTMTEWEFLSEIAERADCGILFDVNNVFVSAYNHGFDASTYVDAMPVDRVVQIHLAGHTNKGAYLLDTHSDHVCEGVWELYDRFIRRAGAITTLVEWDEDIPEWSVLEAEAVKTKAMREKALA